MISLGIKYEPQSDPLSLKLVSGTPGNIFVDKWMGLYPRGGGLKLGGL